MKKYVLMFQNSQQKLFELVNSESECVEKVKNYFENQGKSFDQVLKSFSIRIYIVHIIVQQSQNINCQIISLSNKGKSLDKDKAVIWDFNGKYRNRDINIQLIDKKDVLYAIWDTLEHILGQTNIETIKDLKFNLDVKTKKKGSYNQKQKLVLFFSKEGNWGRRWKYEEVREAMRKEGLSMIGRGIEGERPREFRYDLGYPFLTNEQDKNVPDGSCEVTYPFPTLPRNERRNPNVNLDRKDWSELLEILRSDTKRLRCYECGLFENETNKIGQKTKFQKSHLESHLTGGDTSEENITSICQYCNSEQKNIYNYDKDTGKKIYNTIPFLKTRDYKIKIEALCYLLEHLKREDCIKIIKKKNLL